jgi:hypothetical protein
MESISRRKGRLVFLIVEKLPVHAVVGFPKIYFETGLGSTRRKMKVPNQLIGNKNVVSDSSALNEGLIGFRR